MSSETKITRRKYVAIAGGAVVAVAAGGAAYYLTAPKAAGGKPIRLGAPLPITGSRAGLGGDARDAIYLAVEEINKAGGIMGSPIEVILDDIENLEAGKVSSVFVKLMTRDKVDFLIASVANPSCAEFSAVQENKTPYLTAGFINQAEKLITPNPDAYSYIFLALPSYSLYWYVFADYVTKLEKEGKYKPINHKFCIIKFAQEYSQYIADGMRDYFKKLGWELTFDELLPSNIVNDWSSVLAKIRSNPPAIIISNMNIGSSDALFIKQFNEDPTPSLVYQQASPTYPEYLDMAGTAGNGVFNVYAIRKLAPDNPYIQKFEKRWGRKPSPYGIICYDEVYIMKQAMERAGDSFNKAAIAKALLQTDYNGVMGHYVMDTATHLVKGGGKEIPFPCFQLWDKVNYMLYPPEVAEREFAYPPWYQKGLAKYGK